jgi:hypothetical protein
MSVGEEDVYSPVILSIRLRSFKNLIIEYIKRACVELLSANRVAKPPLDIRFRLEGDYWDIYLPQFTVEHTKANEAFWDHVVQLIKNDQAFDKLKILKAPLIYVPEAKRGLWVPSDWYRHKPTECHIPKCQECEDIQESEVYFKLSDLSV